MEWRPRLKIYASKNRKIRYFQETGAVYSYETKVGHAYGYHKILVLTDHNYSRTTNSHYSEIIHFFREKGYKIARCISTMTHYPDIDKLIKSNEYHIKGLREQVLHKRSPAVIATFQHVIGLFSDSNIVMNELLFSKLIEEQLEVRDVG
jgi:cobalamin biosynthesis Co2+ chelatase CbiK